MYFLRPRRITEAEVSSAALYKKDIVKAMESHSSRYADRTQLFQKHTRKNTWATHFCPSDVPSGSGNAGIEPRRSAYSLTPLYPSTQFRCSKNRLYNCPWAFLPLADLDHCTKIRGSRRYVCVCGNEAITKNNKSQDMCRLGLVWIYTFEDSQNRDSAIL